MYVYGEYFYGNKISDYGLKNGYVDYRTLAKAFDGVMANDIIKKTNGVIGYWEQTSGNVDNTEKIDELREKIEELETELYKYEYPQDDEYYDITCQIEELENKISELEEEQDYYPDIFQYYIVSDSGAELLEEINEIVFYNEELDMYVWGVTHFGTSWDYVLTDIKCNVPYENE